MQKYNKVKPLMMMVLEAIGPSETDMANVRKFLADAEAAGEDEGELLCNLEVCFAAGCNGKWPEAGDYARCIADLREAEAQAAKQADFFRQFGMDETLNIVRRAPDLKDA